MLPGDKRCIRKAFSVAVKSQEVVLAVGTDVGWVCWCLSPRCPLPTVPGVPQRRPALRGLPLRSLAPSLISYHRLGLGGGGGGGGGCGTRTTRCISLSSLFLAPLSSFCCCPTRLFSDFTHQLQAGGSRRSGPSRSGSRSPPAAPWTFSPPFEALTLLFLNAFGPQCFRSVIPLERCCRGS